MTRLYIDEGDLRALEELETAISRYSDEDASKTLQDVLVKQGGEVIINNIMPLLPRSGRTWSGKQPPAASAKPFIAREKLAEDTEHFETDAAVVTVISRGRGKYGYLYFPDDGTGSYRHVGGQNFMGRGAEASKDEVIRLCIEGLTKKFEEVTR